MDNILKIFTGAFSFVYYYRVVLIKSLSIPLAILIALNVSGMLIESKNFWAFIWGITYYLMHTLIAVTTHRVILLGEKSVPEWGYIKISMREIRFILYSIGIGLLMIPLAILAFIPFIGWALALVATVYVLGRLSLVFPAIATDQRWDFQDSWVHTQDHQLMMAVTVVLFPIVLALPETFLASIPYAEIPSAIFSSFTTIFVVAALSVAFKVVRNE